MTPTYLNPSPSPFPADHQLNEDQQYHQLIFTPNLQSSSSSSLSSHAFFNSTILDHSGNYHGHIHQPQYQQEGNNKLAYGGSYDIQENETSDNGLKLALWNKEDHKYEDQSPENNNSIKWMSSKMRLMRKMKNSDRTIMEVPKISTQAPLEDHTKKPSSDPMDTDHSSSNIPIRVCTDCNTTKTPLWRSGPRGPKSLCNACGIRQRKARRAMAAAAAAAAAAADGTILETVSTTSSSMKIKVQTKDKKSNNSHLVVPYKKRSKLFTIPPHDVQKKLCFEDLVINLSKNLDLHRVFPQDEKEAAILLMALSCGLVHG